MVSINLGIWLYGVETGDTGESIEPEESQQIREFPIKVRKQVGDVVQLVRTLPCHRTAVQKSIRQPLSPEGHTLQGDNSPLHSDNLLRPN
jgi:hypothetical protein